VSHSIEQECKNLSATKSNQILAKYYNVKSFAAIVKTGIIARVDTKVPTFKKKARKETIVATVGLKLFIDATPITPTNVKIFSESLTHYALTTRPYLPLFLLSSTCIIKGYSNNIIQGIIEESR
jgi:diacylglycerol kinase family enzyme